MSKNEWISVRDDKPYDGEDVIVAWIPKDRRRCPYKHFWAFTTYYEEGGFEDFLYKDAPFSKDEIEVVAWMPMPEEYEGEEDEDE